MSPLDDYFFTSAELAKQLRKKTGTGSERMLRLWRARRIGPPWKKITNKLIVYPKAGFADWLNDEIQQPVRSRKRAAA